MNKFLLQRLCLPALLAMALACVSVVVVAQDNPDTQSTESPADATSAQDLPVAEQQVVEAADDQSEAEAMAAAAREHEMQMLRQTAATLEAQLASLGTENGLYDLSLAEIQTDLGRIYSDLGEHEKAIDLLTQALHLVRLNSGLYDPQQIRVLEELIEALIANTDWEQVDNYRHLVFSLQKRTYAPDSPEFADAVIAMGNWQLASGRIGRAQGFQALAELSDLKALYASQLEYARAREDLGRQWSFIYADALADIALARQYLRADMGEMMIPVQRYVTQTVCRNVPNGTGGYSRVCWQETVTNPDYYYQVNSQRRSQLERARVSLNSARRDLQELLDNNPEFASANADNARVGLENLDRALTELQRDSRMSMLGVW